MVWQFLKLNIYPPCDPDIPFLSIYSEKKNSYIHTKTCTLVFIATPFEMVKS